MVITGDCIEAMREMAADSVDSIVTDPPYGLGFMGKAWDDLPPGEEWARECLRVLKPGGHLLAFGGSRTYHRLACAVEDAGFEVRDQMMWLYGSGFPKSLDVSKAIDKAAGAEREVVGIGTSWNRPDSGNGDTARMNASPGRYDLTAPATPEAEAWNGWGTALKPAHEPIVVARKPLAGTVAENVLRFGTGALNIDACRIEAGSERFGGGAAATSGFVNGYERGDGFQESEQGRWPANVVMDEEAGRLVNEQSGTSASRFFYCAKASKGERNAGLDGFEGKRIAGKGNGMARTCASCGASVLDGCDCPDRTFENPVRANHHPTVKPISLMRYLVRLVTPPQGIVLDPFLGSGTTGCAAVLEGFDFIGIERDPDYVAIAEARIKHWSSQPQQLGLEAA